MRLSPADRDDRLPALGSLAVFWSLACASPATGLSMHLSVLLFFLFFSCSDRSDQGGKIKRGGEPRIQGENSDCG